MEKMIKKLLVVNMLLMLVWASRAKAALIVYTDRAAFETAVNAPLSFEGFNDNTQTHVDVSGFKAYRMTTSLVSEGDKALSVRESNTLTVSFDHDVFAIGFDVNELNANNLTYSDDAGHEIINALMVTQVWNESSFFGVISDVAINSFSLSGQGGTTTAFYGSDALSYTAPVEVSAPSNTSVLLLAGCAIALLRIKRQSA
ncbi:hypothetical protein HR060_04460 [Catenovulum sp. SM1970]|uniref:hypothetical protein n=1 Tax=Marinifaba aquimaris TaxID=2741323 RepID=UPI001572EC31|nr:hypothetical protein [Marinifaba aquimaris]NTS76114.1 hypothetical protein [Marinifaba aquimaris]